MNVCRQCGQVINHDFATIVIKVIEKSVYLRKYRVNKVLNNTIDKYHIMLSYDEISEFYRLFQIAEQQMVQMKIKRFVKFNYIFFRIFSWIVNVIKYLFNKNLGKQTLKKYDSIFEDIVFAIQSYFLFFFLSYLLL